MALRANSATVPVNRLRDMDGDVITVILGVHKISAVIVISNHKSAEQNSVCVVECRK